MKTTTKGITAAAVSLALAMFASLTPAKADDGLEPSAMTNVTRSLNPANWKLPRWRMPDFTRMLPGGEKKVVTKATKKRNRLMDRVTKSASNGWNRTRQAFDARKLNPINYLPASAKMPAKEKPTKSKPGFFRSLFMAKDPDPQESGTVTEFLRQDRPGL